MRSPSTAKDLQKDRNGRRSERNPIDKKTEFGEIEYNIEIEINICTALDRFTRNARVIERRQVGLY